MDKLHVWLIGILGACLLLRYLVSGEDAQATANAEAHNEHGDKHQQDLKKFVKDVGHIKEHLKEQYGFTDERAEQYLKEYDAQTQFFLMHDYDNNTKLDGLELLKSMTHVHGEEHEGEGSKGHEETDDNTDTLVEFVDMIMKDQDLDNDGYIDYPEYINYYTKFDDDTKVEDTATSTTP